MNYNRKLFLKTLRLARMYKGEVGRLIYDDTKNWLDIENPKDLTEEDEYEFTTTYLRTMAAELNSAAKMVFACSPLPNRSALRSRLNELKNIIGAMEHVYEINNEAPDTSTVYEYLEQGKKNAKKRFEIMTALNLSEREFATAICKLREMGNPIINHGDEYYIAGTKEEVNSYLMEQYNIFVKNLEVLSRMNGTECRKKNVLELR